MKKIKPIAILISFVFAASLTPVLGQLGTISGVVTDADGNPLKDVQIEIQGLTVKRTYKVKTKKDGKFIHAGVALQGSYRVIASLQGYQSDYAEGVRPSFGSDERGHVEFSLKKGAGGKLAFEYTDEELAKMAKDRENQEKRQQDFASMKATFDQGIAAYNEGRYEEALASFQQAAEKGEDQPAIWAYLGNSYQRLERLDEGIEAYQKAILLSPEDSALYQNLGNLYASKGNAEKANESYEKAAELSAAEDPSQAATTYYNMGVTHINSGKTQEAADALMKAIEIDPTYAEAYYQLGITLIGLNKLEDSIAQLKKYVEIAPTGQNAETAKALIEQLGG
jgi:Flp pilus assembly protein TadD